MTTRTYQSRVLAILVAVALQNSNAFTPTSMFADSYATRLWNKNFWDGRRCCKSVHPIEDMKGNRSKRNDVLISKLSVALSPDDPVGYDASRTDPTASSNKRNEIQPHLLQLLLMCRPINFPIVTLFHVLGVHLALEVWKSASVNNGQPFLLPLLKHPSMLMVLLSLLLVTSTSMITNDYYDARNGVDVTIETEAGGDGTNEHYHPLARGLLSFSTTKTFDSYLYAILLLSSAFVPGVISRLMVIGGAIVTYLYTVHLKPRTWIKNLSCAALVSMSPVTSGLAAWHVLCSNPIFQSQAIGAVDSVRNFSSKSILQSPLAYLVIALFAGITSREILMDITDSESDARAGIITIPVKYGRNVASLVAFAWSALSATAACVLPISGIDEVQEGVHEVIRTFNAEFFHNLSFGADSFQHFFKGIVFSISIILKHKSLRRLCLSVIGSSMLLHRAYSVTKSKGEDMVMAENAVSSSLFSVLLVLASFV